jgi:hypothetical protein
MDAGEGDLNLAGDVEMMAGKQGGTRLGSLR